MCRGEYSISSVLLFLILFVSSICILKSNSGCKSNMFTSILLARTEDFSAFNLFSIVALLSYLVVILILEMDS